MRSHLPAILRAGLRVNQAVSLQLALTTVPTPLVRSRRQATQNHR